MNHLALAAALAVAVAAPAAATTTFNITSAGVFNTADVSVGSSGYLGGSFRLVGTRGSQPFDVYGFCVDLAHTIGVGINSMAPVDLVYVFDDLTTAPGGGPLSAAQLNQMNGLAFLGFKLLQAGTDPDLGTKLPAIQALIWETEYNQLATSSNPGVQAQIDAIRALAPSLKGSAFYIRPADGRPVTQGLFISDVPEPATWAMLIAGFGLVGFAARRRRVADPAHAAA
jgi:hypothetical protein